MDAETLERLTLDRALGELSPDVSALLGAYLAGRPDDLQAARRTEGVIREARQMLAGELPAPLRPFPAELLAWELAGRRRWVWAGRVARLAACVLIGVGLHAAWAGRSAPPDARQGAAHLAMSHQRDGEKSVAGDTGFWSMRRLYERSERRKPEGARRVIWDSPLSTPRLGDST